MVVVLLKIRVQLYGNYFSIKLYFEVKETPHGADLKVLAFALKMESSTLIGYFPPGDAFGDFTCGGSIV